jgi:hypothetical protein
VAAAAAAVPTRAGTFAAGVRIHGPRDFRETRFTGGYARTLPLAPARRLAVALRGDVHILAIEGFGSTSTADVTAGVQADILPALRAGLAARNVAGIARADSADLRVPLSADPTLLAGLAFRPGASTLLLLAWEKQLDFPPVARAGFEFAAVGALLLRAGASTAASGVPARLSFGAGLHAGRARADIAVEWHEVLGASPAFGIAFRP